MSVIFVVKCLALWLNNHSFHPLNIKPSVYLTAVSLQTLQDASGEKWF